MSSSQTWTEKFFVASKSVCAAATSIVIVGKASHEALFVTGLGGAGCTG